MNDSEELGSLSGDPRDDRLQADDAGLELPRGVFIAFRQSGGLRFSMREMMVYDDGQVFARWQGKLDSGEGSRRLTPDEVAELKELIKHIGLSGLPRSIGSQSPDSYAYEIIARLDHESRSIEFFDGSIPSEIQPLLAQLKTLATINDTQE
jgi:hypothetical protein